VRVRGGRGKVVVVVVLECMKGGFKELENLEGMGEK